MTTRRKPLSPATVARLNAVLKQCAERAERRNAELEAMQYVGKLLAVAIEMAREAE